MSLVVLVPVGTSTFKKKSKISRSIYTMNDKNNNNSYNKTKIRNYILNMLQSINL